MKKAIVKIVLIITIPIWVPIFAFYTLIGVIFSNEEEFECPHCGREVEARLVGPSSSYTPVMVGMACPYCESFILIDILAHIFFK